MTTAPTPRQIELSRRREHEANREQGSEYETQIRALAPYPSDAAWNPDVVPFLLKRLDEAREQSFDAAGMFKYRLLDMIRCWELASHEDETSADTFRNGYLSGQNWAASELRTLLWDAEQTALIDERLSEGHF